MHKPLDLLLFPKANLSMVRRESVPVRQLPNFRKNHTVPSHAGDSAARFIGGLVRSELESDLTAIHRLLRSELQLKRAEIDVSMDDYGCGIMTTDDFRYWHTYEFSGGQTEKVSQVRKLDQIADLNFLLSENMKTIFGVRFNSVELDFGIEIDVEQLIDAIEDLNDPEIQLDYNLDATECQVQFSEIPEVLGFDADRIRLTSEKSVSTHQLVSNLKQVQARFVDAFRSANML